MKTILILTAVIALLILFAIILLKCLKTERAKRKELEQTVKNQEKNLVYLYKHSQEIAAIESEKNKISQKIKDGKSDEEIVNIINSVIASNNSRVQDHSKTESNSSTSARQRNHS